MSGNFAASQMQERDGDSNFRFTWNHAQRFSTDRRINASINYASSTNLQQHNAYNPYAAIETIFSTVALQDKIGPFSLSAGVRNRQNADVQVGEKQFLFLLSHLRHKRAPAKKTLLIGDWSGIFQSL